MTTSAAHICDAHGHLAAGNRKDCEYCGRLDETKIFNAGFAAGMERAVEICEEHFNKWLQKNQLHKTWQSVAINAIRAEIKEVK